MPPPYSPFGIVPSNVLYSIGMILDFHGEPPHRRVVARPLRHGPALHHAVELEAEIEVQMARRVLLHDEAQAALRARRASASRRFLGFREVALALVLGERRPLGRGALRRAAFGFRRHGQRELGNRRATRAPRAQRLRAALIIATPARITAAAPSVRAVTDFAGDRPAEEHGDERIHIRVGRRLCGRDALAAG